MTVEYVTVRSTPEGKFVNKISLGDRAAGEKFHLKADEPKEFGGQDSAPAPYDYLMAALGACTSMTLRMYADRKKWPLEGVEVTLRHDKIHAEDCEHCETTEGMVDQIEREIHLSGELSTEQRARLIDIANKCPVHRTLHAEVSIITRET